MFGAESSNLPKDISMCSKGNFPFAKLKESFFGGVQPKDPYLKKRRGEHSPAVSLAKGKRIGKGPTLLDASEKRAHITGT